VTTAIPHNAAGLGAPTSESTSTQAARTVIDSILKTLSDHSDDDDPAAQDLLNTIFSCANGRAIKSKEEIMDLLMVPIQRRKTYIDRLAIKRGVAQPAAGEYTVEQWKEWLEHWPLGQTDMDGAIAEWKQDFKNQDFIQTEQVRQWRDEATRESKNEARKLIRGAWKSELTKRYGRHQLATALLKYPATHINLLLKAWTEFMESPEFHKEKERTRDETEKERAVKLKVMVHGLRHQRRRAEKLHRLLENKTILTVPPQDQNLYNRWTTGALSREIDDATHRHGYGKLSNGRFLVAPRLDHFLPSR
jgi:hypothetical protein